MHKITTLIAAITLCALPLIALSACTASASSSSSGSASQPKSGASTSSNSGSSSSVARPTDMCALLSTAEASTAMKTTISSTYAAEKTNCGYSGTDLHFGTALAPTNLPGFAFEKSLLKLDVGKMVPISGVGDEAAGNSNGIAFRVGTVIIDIEADPGTTSTTQDEMVAAAKIIVSHLH